MGEVVQCKLIVYSHIQHSWSDKMVERVKNMINTDNTERPSKLETVPPLLR